MAVTTTSYIQYCKCPNQNFKSIIVNGTSLQAQSCPMMRSDQATVIRTTPPWLERAHQVLHLF